MTVRLAPVVSPKRESPFSVITITNEQEFDFELDVVLTRQALQLASTSGASMVLIHSDTPRTLIIGILDQVRYWTASRGRLCALRVLREGMGPFEK